jgi:hypothetical protein
MGAVFSDEAENDKTAEGVTAPQPDSDDEVELTPVTQTPAQQGGGNTKRYRGRRQTHHRSRAGGAKRKTMRSRAASY